MNGNYLEKLWSKIYSRNNFNRDKPISELTEQEKQAVQSHLNRMATEPDWPPEQILSVKVLLNPLTNRK